MSKEKKIEIEVKLVLYRKKQQLSKTCDPGSIENLPLPDVVQNLLSEHPPKIFLAQQDIYFDHPQFALAKNDLVLRRRQNIVFVRKKRGWSLNKHEDFLTYKGQAQKDSFTKSRREIEAIANEEVFSILEELGFQKNLEVHKHRWSSFAQDIHLSLDVVENLGVFFEVEIVSLESEKKIALEKISHFLNKWKLNYFEKELKSYAELLSKKN